MQRVFISYSHKDEALRAELDVHLALLRREELMEIWTDHRILAGDEVHPSIAQGLEEADIVFLLISPDFNNSNYCGDEMKRALARQAQGKCVAVPILLRPCDWQTADYARLNVIPRNNRPVTEWTSRDAAFTEIVKELRELLKRQALAGAAAKALRPGAAAIVVPSAVGSSALSPDRKPVASTGKRWLAALVAVGAVAGVAGLVVVNLARQPSDPRIPDTSAVTPPSDRPAMHSAASNVAAPATGAAPLPTAKPADARLDVTTPATVSAAPRTAVATAAKSSSRGVDAPRKVANATWTTSDECLRLTGLLAKGALEPGDAQKLKEACNR